MKSIELIERLTGLQLPKQAMLDVQVKRIHEVRRGGVGKGGCRRGLLGEALLQQRSGLRL